MFDLETSGKEHDGDGDNNNWPSNHCHDEDRCQNLDCCHYRKGQRIGDVEVQHIHVCRCLCSSKNNGKKTQIRIRETRIFLDSFDP